MAKIPHEHAPGATPDWCVTCLRDKLQQAHERGETLALLNEQVATEAEKAGLGHLPTPVAVEQLRERAEAVERERNRAQLACSQQRVRAEAAEELAHRRLVLLCNVQSHTTVSADIIRMIDDKAEAPVITPAEAQKEADR